MKIYGFPTFNVTKVLFTAEVLGLEYEYINLDPTKGEHKTPEHMARHPLGKVPVIEHNGEFIIESGAICRYLAAQADSPLYGGDAANKAQIDAMLDFVSLQVGKWLATFFWEDIIRHFFQKDANPAAKEEAQGFLDQQLPVLEKRLSMHKYLCGDQITVADTVAAAICQTTEVTSASFSDYPAITAWYQALRESEAFSRSLAHFPGGQIFNSNSLK